MNTFEKIYEIVRRIPSGRVSTYGRIALMAGNPHWSRVVGYAMRACGDTSVPCHRVIMKSGELPSAFGVGGSGLQRALLESEGVAFLQDGRVCLEKHLWP